jgi:branched-chain amino acid transport system ATP-binding protein
VLDVRSFGVRYGGVTALNGVEFTVEEGGVLGIVGPNGAGKTSLLSALVGLHPPTEGSEAMFDGFSMVGATTHELVGWGIVLVPEGRRVFQSMTVEENLLVGGHTQPHRMRARMLNMMSVFPVLADRRKQLAGHLSGGEQQMLAIARALMSGPRLLLMDEPFMGLAPVVISAIGAAIGELQAGGVTVVVAEQNVQACMDLCTSMSVISLGCIVGSGRPEDLAKNEEFVRTYLGLL